MIVVRIDSIVQHSLHILDTIGHIYIILIDAIHIIWNHKLILDGNNHSNYKLNKNGNIRYTLNRNVTVVFVIVNYDEFDVNVNKIDEFYHIANKMDKFSLIQSLVVFYSVTGEVYLLLINCPLHAQTKHLFNEELIKCKPDIFIVNTARGKIVDENAMAKAVEEGHVGTVAAGRIGYRVLKRLKPFNVNLHYFDTIRLSSEQENELDVTCHDSVEKMLKECDAITVIFILITTRIK